VILGGQIFSKSLRGVREGDVPGLLEKEGIVLAVLIFVLPLVFMALFNRVLPVLRHRTSEIVPAPRTGLADRVSVVPSPVWFRRRGTRRFLERVRGPGLRLRHVGEEN
jgi:hypothetical protein